jgi:hypothetical protein
LDISPLENAILNFLIGTAPIFVIPGRKSPGKSFGVTDSPDVASCRSATVRTFEVASDAADEDAGADDAETDAAADEDAGAAACWQALNIPININNAIAIIIVFLIFLSSLLFLF